VEHFFYERERESLLFTNKYIVKSQYSYSPSKGSMARDTRGLQKWKINNKKKIKNPLDQGLTVLNLKLFSFQPFVDTFCRGNHYCSYFFVLWLRPLHPKLKDICFAVIWEKKFRILPWKGEFPQIFFILSVLSFLQRESVI